ncbi:MAG TPA: 7TM diverse intracellular signaling domain-containing protein, partial [Leptospiraceae bacterium]|nr:7TM diverse intracellular signaling domain-containing protein [Leptospiraceae bacterium]
MMRGTKPGLWELPVLILLLAAPFSFLTAQPSLLNLRGAERRLLGPEMDLLVDENGTLNFQDVLSGKYIEKFQRATQAVPNFGFSGRVYWARLSLKNPGPSQEWLIQIAYPHLDSIKLYESSGRHWKASETGDMFPFRIRPLKHRTFFFPIHFERGEIKTIYLRFQSQGVLEFPVFVMKAEGLLAQDHEEQFILGIYYGILLVLAVYNLILFFIVRDIAYLYYLLYISGYGTLQLVLNGLAFEYLWPEYPVWANYSLPFSVAWTFFWGIFFVRRLLSTRAIAPFSDQLLAILQTLLLIMMPAVFFISYHFAINAAAYVAILFALLVLAAGFICAIRGYEPARYFLVAWAAVLCGVLLYGLKAFAVLPSNFVTEYGLQFGSAVEMCLLSLGLANRMSVLEREKTKALQYSYEVERAHQEARILQARLETDLLKRNIQPHFIMNSINAV